MNLLFTYFNISYIFHNRKKMQDLIITYVFTQNKYF